MNVFEAQQSEVREDLAAQSTSADNQDLEFVPQATLCLQERCTCQSGLAVHHAWWSIIQHRGGIDCNLASSLQHLEQSLA